MKQLFFISLVSVFSFLLVFGIVFLKAVFKYIAAKMPKKNAQAPAVTYIEAADLQEAV
jgi:hypothetical protein